MEVSGLPHGYEQIMKPALPSYERNVNTCCSLKDISDCSTPVEEHESCNPCQTEENSCSLIPVLRYNTISDRLISIQQELAYRLSEYSFTPPVEYVYNPLDYAFDVHAEFVRKFCQSQKKILFLGMNPGPWGMSQTGVPFGEVSIVREWLQVGGEIHRPQKECPARPIQGFSCKRKEISGWKFWNFFKDVCVDPFRFFSDAFVYNYCPLAFMTGTGKNITPAEMKGNERRMINLLCDKTFCELLDLLHINTVIAVGKFAEKSASAAMKANGLHNIRIVTIPHPSPRNFGTKNWQEETKTLLEERDLMRFFL